MILINDIMKKYLNLLLIVLIFSTFLSVTYFVHINYFYVDVIFYSALFDVLISIILTYIVCFNFLRFFSLTKFELFQSSLICCLIGYCVAITGPALVDRSLSFYILEKIRQHDGSVRVDKLEDIFIYDYVDEYSLVSVRMTEQTESGTLVIRDGCLHLTNLGYIMTSASMFIRKNLLAKNRLLGEEYTDKLTDPLKDSIIKEEYKCFVK